LFDRKGIFFHAGSNVSKTVLTFFDNLISQPENPENFLLMHAMACNVSSVIGAVI